MLIIKQLIGQHRQRAHSEEKDTKTQKRDEDGRLKKKQQKTRKNT